MTASSFRSGMQASWPPFLPKNVNVGCIIVRFDSYRRPKNDTVGDLRRQQFPSTVHSRTRILANRIINVSNERSSDEQRGATRSQ